MPASVAMKGGTWIQAIQKPWNAPISRPDTSITTTAIHMLAPACIITAPMAPVKQTTEPTDRSMLPPVSMQHSMPAASTKT